MAIYIGSTQINNMYIGSTLVSQIYSGANFVARSGTSTPIFATFSITRGANASTWVSSQNIQIVPGLSLSSIVFFSPSYGMRFTRSPGSTIGWDTWTGSGGQGENLYIRIATPHGTVDLSPSDKFSATTTVSNLQYTMSNAQGTILSMLAQGEVATFTFFDGDPNA